MTRIAIVGEYRADNETHRATSVALASADTAWVTTDELDVERLRGFDGVFVAPGSPYRDECAALAAIRHARERGVPLVGT